MNVIIGEKYLLNLTKASTVMITGETNLAETILSGLTKKFSTNDLKLCLIDPTKGCLGTYSGSPYLMAPIAKSENEIIDLLTLVDQEMRRRYHLFAFANVKTLDAYNKGDQPNLPYIVVVFENLGNNQRVDPFIIFLAQMAKATGIHLILTAQVAPDPITPYINTHITTLGEGKLEIKVGKKRTLERMCQNVQN